MIPDKIILEDRKIPILNRKFESIKYELVNHRVYEMISDRSSLKIFMENHIFAVWDFMSILKSLQREITCVRVPWKPSLYNKDLVRFVNEIVLDEESDLNKENQASDHFSMYINSMLEVGADVSLIQKYLESFDSNILPVEIRDFVEFTLSVARDNKVHITAGIFYFGRENIIPDMFRTALESIENGTLMRQAPSLRYYLSRHIEVDSESHGPLAGKLLEATCRGDAVKFQESLTYGIKACLLRKVLLDRAADTIQQHKKSLHS